MQVNFDAEILDTEGGPIDLGEDGRPPGLTLKTVVMRVCTMSAPDDIKTPGLPAALFEIALVARQGGEQQITTDEATMIKRRLEQVWSPWIVGYASKLIDGQDPLAARSSADAAASAAAIRAAIPSVDHMPSRRIGPPAA